jgi:uncharacterized protein with beta-barrel porin domain
MCGLLRPLGTMTTAVTRNVAIVLACAVLLTGVTLSPVAHAQNGFVGFVAPPAPTPTPTPTVLPSPVPTVVNADVSAGSTMLDLGSNYLERLGDQMTGGLNAAQRSNPGGGGAPAAAEPQRFRVWTETYGITASTSAQGPFFGDQRKTWGGTAGFGATVLPGVNLGLSVDHSHTSVDVPLALQSAGLDVTQFAFTASVDRGPWTWALALAHGNGNINSMRDTGLGFATAAYGAQINGALTELSYFWALDQSRIVPKIALEYMRSTTASFQEMGGLDPVSASGSALERSRALVGAEVGHYWIFDQKVFDLSAYGKFVDNFSQNASSVLVSLGPQSIAVQGIVESQYGADAGAAASLSLTNQIRVYAAYDGKFRSNLQSHQGTAGIELRW